ALLGACRAAASMYAAILHERPEGQPGRDYLRRRGVEEAVQRELGLGFAPDRWDTAAGALQSKGYRAELLQAAGIVQRSDKGGRYYDRFRNRIIFPIVNLSGDVVAFGGRIVGEGEVKYLNSPETLIYNKRENLFGLHLARHAIKDAGFAVVVEGYLDWVSLYAAGIRNCVATLGTAFTDEQVALLRRFSEQVVVNYDADPAGESATRRSLERLLARGIIVKVLQLPEGKDPDDFVRQSGPEAYSKLLDEAPPCFDFLVEAASKGRDLGDPAMVAAAAREVLPVLAQVSSRLERSRYVGLLAERLGVEDGLLLAEMRETLVRGTRGGSRGEPTGSPEGRAPKKGPPLREVEARLVQALVESGPCRARLLAELLPADLQGSVVARIVDGLASLERSGEEVTYPSVAEGLQEGDKEVLTRIAMRGDPVPGEAEALHCLETLRRGRLVRERTQIQREMESTSDPVRLEELMRRKIDLSRRIDAIS
ncbi:MAG TPA: DNA primase, partial [Candidatus Saccharimonadales bacterium]|nr:DNA primase [Candidatus Saccharimonadales bacterium]